MPRQVLEDLLCAWYMSEPRISGQDRNERELLQAQDSGGGFILTKGGRVTGADQLWSTSAPLLLSEQEHSTFIRGQESYWKEKYLKDKLNSDWIREGNYMAADYGEASGACGRAGAPRRASDYVSDQGSDPIGLMATADGYTQLADDERGSAAVPLKYGRTPRDWGACCLKVLPPQAG